MGTKDSRGRGCSCLVTGGCWDKWRDTTDSKGSKENRGNCLEKWAF